MRAACQLDFRYAEWEMSSFLSKLERVRLPLTIERDVTTNASLSAYTHETHQVGTKQNAPLPTDPRQRLDALRDRIAAILAKTTPPRRPLADPTLGDLPFVRESTKKGPLYVRTKRLSAAHRVGRASVSAGKNASSGMLALLALDPTLASLNPERALYVDTETTGLSGGAGTVPFLIGLAWFELPGPTLIVEQLLLRQMGEETPMLERVADRIARASMLVTYNGKSFDVPLLRARFVLNRLKGPPPLPHLDLVHVARRIHRHRVPALNLVNVEAEVLGFQRTADIAGGEVCARYAHYLRSGDESALAAVMDHNEWDLTAMAALVGLYGEPLDGLSAVDWAHVARTIRRAGSLELAGEIANRAVLHGAGHDAVRARGEIAKARGDKAQALADFASLVDTVDDEALRLELAKLYEHYAKAPLMALQVVERGTGEGEEAWMRRKTRLERKRKRGQG